MAIERYIINYNEFEKVLNDTLKNIQIKATIVNKSPNAIKKISSGMNFNLFLTNEGKVYSCGENNNGQLGLGDNNERNIPTLIPNLTNIKDISCGRIHSFFLTNNNEVYSCGYNQYGQLGLGDNNDRNSPTLIPNLTNIKNISCGGYFTYFITNDGLVYSCGENEKGQLGLGNNIDQNIPILVPNLNNIINISCGNYHVLFLTNDELVYSCGENDKGQLGLGDNNDRNIPTLIPNLTNIKNISCGIAKSLFLNNKVYSCGYNYYGQLGLGDNNDRNIPTLIPNFTNIKDISKNYGYFTFFLDINNLIYSCGRNNYGQLGLGDNNDRNIPTLIPNFTNIKEVSCGINHTIIISNEGKIYSCGRNNYGQLGLNDNDNKNIPTLIPNLSTSNINIGNLEGINIDISQLTTKVDYFNTSINNCIIANNEINQSIENNTDLMNNSYTIYTDNNETILNILKNIIATDSNNINKIISIISALTKINGTTVIEGHSEMIPPLIQDNIFSKKVQTDSSIVGLSINQIGRKMDNQYSLRVGDKYYINHSYLKEIAERKIFNNPIPVSANNNIDFIYHNNTGHSCQLFYDLETIDSYTTYKDGSIKGIEDVDNDWNLGFELRWGTCDVDFDLYLSVVYKTNEIYLCGFDNKKIYLDENNYIYLNVDQTISHKKENAFNLYPEIITVKGFPPTKASIFNCFFFKYSGDLSTLHDNVEIKIYEKKNNSINILKDRVFTVDELNILFRNDSFIGKPNNHSVYNFGLEVYNKDTGYEIIN